MPSHVNSLAAHGVRFTSGYVSGIYCSPSRAGLRTGRYQTLGHEFNGGALRPACCRARRRWPTG